MNLGISIIICCYNSNKRLANTLRHLANQKNIEKINIEILLIDNASNDNTSEIALKEWERFNSEIKLKIYAEPIPGLSNARKKGIKQAKYDYIIFCDDDNWLEENYLSYAYQIMENQTNIGALCGQNIGFTNSNFPTWFYDVAKFYAVGKLALKSGDVSSNGWIWGAGMVLRKQILENCLNAGFDNLTSDRKGKELSTGGDVEMCKWILMSGYKLWYDERLTLQHCIPDERLNLDYINRLKFENNQLHLLFGIYDYFISKENKNAFFYLKLIYRLFKSSFKGKINIHDKIKIYGIYHKLGIKTPSKNFNKINENLTLLKTKMNEN